MATMPLHLRRPRVTLYDILTTLEQGEDLGLCRGCGAQREAVPPLARRLTCPCCQQRQLYGTSALLELAGVSDRTKVVRFI